MTDTEKLEALIKKAINGGWKPEEWVQGPQHLAHSLISLDKVNTVIFSRDFAKALFGEDWPSKYPEGDMRNAAPIKKRINGAPWQYHLQQAVVSNDPIDYMYKSVFGETK